MTSRSLFFKLIRQDCKRRIWFPIVAFIAFFLTLEVPMTMRLDEIIRNPKYYEYTASEFIANYTFGWAGLASAVVFCVCIAAFLSAFSGFGYMQLRAQTDTYHSMPVSRGMLFGARYLSGVLQFLLPFAANVFICVGIAVGQKSYAPETLPNALWFIAMELLIFVLTYSACIAAVCLTGNIIISALGAGGLFFASSLLALLKGMMFQSFFHTYISFADTETLAFSPFGMLVKLADRMDACLAESGTLDYGFVWEYLRILIPAAAVYALAAYVLYRLRSSEACGRAIAFGAAEPIIKTIILIPAALYSGLFFGQLAVPQRFFGWFLFGAVFGFVVLGLLLEVVFRMDIREIFGHKRQLAFNGVCLALLILIFAKDVLGFNTYVPLDAQLQSCAVSISGVMDVSTIGQRSNRYESNTTYLWMNASEYRMNNMQIQGNPSVMELARKAAKEGLQYTSYKVKEGSPEYRELLEREKSYHEIVFGYQMLNGKRMYRRYIIDLADAETRALLEDVFNDYGYKIGSSPVLNSGWSKEYVKACCRSNFNAGEVALTPGKQAKLLETYQAEYLRLTLEEVFASYPVGSLSFLTPEDVREGFFSGYGVGEYLIYPQFTETLALLKDYGFDYYEGVSVEAVSEIDVCVSQGEESMMLSYTDKEELARLLDSIVCGSLTEGSYACADELYEDSAYCNLIGAVTAGEGRRFYYFKKGMIPDFVLEDSAVLYKK
ncbi:MAG: DUF6449 domain-containing protein [Roseburia sp.]|nr:DUF6449 domain-containing protein [Roseburia sp.]